MSTVENKSLMLDLVEWIADKPRSYSEVMAAWRTSCPRFPIWEDAVDLRFVTVHAGGDDASLMVSVTPEGIRFVEVERGR